MNVAVKPTILGKPYRPKRGSKLGKVTHIVLHYSATYPEQDTTVQDIDLMHRNRKPPFACIGYHFFISRDGRIWYGRDLKFRGAHVGGQNEGKIGICCAGGIDKATGPNVGVDNRTQAQKDATVRLVHWLKAEYGQPTVCGHRDLKPTQCPGFDVGKWWTEVHTPKEVPDNRPKPPVQKHTDIRTEPSQPKPTGLRPGPIPKPKPKDNWFVRFFKRLFGG